MTASSYYFPPILLICDDVQSHSVVFYVKCRCEYSGTYKLRHVEEEVFSGTYIQWMWMLAHGDRMETTLEETKVSSRAPASKHTHDCENECLWHVSQTMTI